MSISASKSRQIGHQSKQSHHASADQFQPGNDGWYSEDQRLLSILELIVTVFKMRYGSPWLVQRLASFDDDFTDAYDDPETWH